jgi:hypothetical protein
MSGGLISENSSTNGGGIVMKDASNYEIKGEAITDNIAEEGDPNISIEKGMME